MRWTHLIVATALTACSVGPAERSTAIDRSVSGLRPGGMPGETGALGPGASLIPGTPDDADPEPTVLEPGDYTAVVVTVRQVDPARTDLYEGAEWISTVASASQGYHIDDWISLDGMDGKLAGRAFEQVVDPDYDCSAELALEVRGFVRRDGSVRLVVDEQEFVAGKQCDQSDLGPSGMAHSVYRLEMIPVE